MGADDLTIGPRQRMENIEKQLDGLNTKLSLKADKADTNALWAEMRGMRRGQMVIVLTIVTGCIGIVAAVLSTVPHG